MCIVADVEVGVGGVDVGDESTMNYFTYSL
jgi:hypothetical protein